VPADIDTVADPSFPPLQDTGTDELIATEGPGIFVSTAVNGDEQPSASVIVTV
jgi:hypothetical protein